jgi:hypothetical protein
MPDFWGSLVVAGPGPRWSLSEPGTLWARCGATGTLGFMEANDPRDPAALAKRLWFPGPAAPYSPAQRQATSELVVAYVDRATAAYSRPRRDPDR